MTQAIGGDGARYHRSFTGDGTNGQRQPRAIGESNPLARGNDVTFPSGAWTRGMGHGELGSAPPNQPHLLTTFRGHGPGRSGGRPGPT